jgi:glycosyltransferase involved in cell wall biosynthesis
VKVLLCHNYYQQPGGEDQVYADEAWLLQRGGHEVIRFEQHNDVLKEKRAWDAAKTTFWSRESYQALRRLVATHRPDVAHFHNTFPLISPSGYQAVREAGIPVVQTLHNFRLICPGALLMRSGAPCERCVTKRFAWPGIVHGCYRESRKATAVTAAAMSWHGVRGTWRNCVDRFIATTQQARALFVSGGLPEEKLAVKPNFVRPDPGRFSGPRQGAIFVGRLSPEKGIETLLEAWQRLGDRIPLRIVGDGPLRDEVLQAQRSHPGIEWLGRLPFDQVLEQIGAAKALLFPSLLYETFGRTMIEAFATGTPVIASDLGAMRELVADEVTGLRFLVGDAAALVAQIDRLWADEILWERLSEGARREFERHYTADRNLQLLQEIYEQAITQLAPLG